MLTVTVFAPQVFHLIETVAHFLAIDGACRVRLATTFEGDERTEHPWALRRIRQVGHIEVSGYETAHYSDILIFSLVQHGRISEKFAPWRERARSVLYLSSACACPFGWREWVREAVRSFPHYLHARRIKVAPYVHPQFLTNSEWSKAAFGSVDIDRRRKFRLGFIGNRNPPERISRLAQCKGAIVGAKGQTYWNEYGDAEATGPRGLGPIEYMDALSDMDLCISPPGWGLCYAHRTIEALARCSIPIIENPQLYDLELRDDENCIVAKPDNWGAAVRRALDMTEADIVRMRRNVVALREERLLPARGIQRFRTQLFT
jgi:hypothetical protein